MKVLITGSSGFIGSYLLRELVNEGYDILALKRHSSDLWRVEDIKDQVRWINEDENADEAITDFSPEFVFHLAWDGVSSAERVIWSKQVNNICFQQRLLDLSKLCGVKKFIGIGSQSEYGAFEGVVDESYKENPMTAYAAAKLACKNILKAFCEINQIEWYWFRLFPVFGPYESEKWLIPSLIKEMMTSDSMDLTPGEQKLPYLYVGECAKAILSPLKSKDRSGVYNISASNPQPLKDLVQTIREKVNPCFKLNFGAIDYRYGQSMYMGGSTEKIARELYVIDSSNFNEHLDETIKFYMKRYGRNSI